MGIDRRATADGMPGSMTRRRWAGYLPSGVESLSRTYHPLLPFYQFPWVGQTAPISQQAVGYMVSGFIGIGAVMLLGWLLYVIVRRSLPKRVDDEDWRTAT